MKRLDYNNKIIKYLSRFVEEVKAYNAGSLYDINIHAENALIPILDCIFDINLKNANAHLAKNFPGVDLVDDINRIAFQVTATASIDKIKNTLDKFSFNNLNQKYDTLYVYVLTEKQGSYSESALKEHIPENFSFEIKNHIIDLSDLAARITYMQSLEKLEQLARLCEHEFSDSQIEQRAKKFKSGFLKNEPEKLYVNLLKVSFPDSLYIADINLDLEAVKERINQRRIAHGRRKKSVFKQGELFWDELYERNIFTQDYILRGNQLITFRNLYDPSESFTGLIDKGTITSVNPSEYFNTNEPCLNNFKHLLRQVLIEFGKQKGLEWINAKELLRFKNNTDFPNQKKIKWKGKNEATKTVIFEMMSKKDKDGHHHIICYRNMAFWPAFMNLGNDWYLVVNPTWSFTNPGGYYPSRFEETYLKGLKRQESNAAVYYQYRFFGYYLSYYDLFTEVNPYPYFKVHASAPLNFAPKLEDDKWLPPKEFVPTNDFEAALVKDAELNKTLFE